MLRSMTGFGRGEYLGRLKQVTVEIKAVNHRFSEVQVRLPYQYAMLEERVRKLVLNYFSRGRIDVVIKLENTSGKQRELQVDKDLAVTYYKKIEELAVAIGIPCEVNVVQIAQFPEVLVLREPEEEMEIIWQDLLPALQKAVDVLLQMREKEGWKLKEDLVRRIQTLQQIHSKILQKSPQVVEIYRQKLATRLQEVLPEGQIDEERLALEVALLADKCNLDEELVRLNSHFMQFAQALEEDTAVGRKLDFLLQEMNREVNTIGSKANDVEITQAVVALKSELEKIREQVQNIE
ncbi:MAG: YicC family protein [Clostridia bacterium]|nr:YicC family protein [Clostridia bacterium]MDD4146249.1 YicC family protein [Clostridia bacterium]MDD4665049.1 YicC family protein [Clostridia bacterium]